MSKLSQPPVVALGVKIGWLRLLQVILDTFLIGMAFACSYLIRFDGHPGQNYIDQLLVLLVPLTLAKITINWFLGVYRRLWRYTGLTEVMELGVSLLISSALLLVVRLLGWLNVYGHQLSAGIILIDCGLSFLLLVSPRILRRLQTEHRQRRHWRQPIRKRALLIGAGDAGQLVLRELNQRPDLGVDVIGLLDDDPEKLRRRIGSLTVFGTTDDLTRLVDNLFIDQVIIAMPSAPAAEIRRIVDLCREVEVEPKILPGLFELINGRVSVSQLREVSLEDLLGREPVKLDTASIASYLEDKCVLITGAGGSIGSELCRQIVRYQPRRLILLGKGENSIFSIYQELQGRPEPVEFLPIIADIRDENRLEKIFSDLKPDVIFHAAAHKHVPLMEANVCEAITNNIFGTQVVANLAARHGVNTFILVSSDKAVNPSSVMGATKRIAEFIVQDLAIRSKTKYVAVRFGNVLASRGSVVPIWRQQIAGGGPVTVTHPDATRYFMLIPEAVQLILQAAALGAGGEIFVLDMGGPVKILDLANDLIRFSGLKPGQDIQIEFTGLRPGEKLYEELLTASEALSKTSYEKILVGKPEPLETNLLKQSLNKLGEYSQSGNEGAIRQCLSDLIGSSLLIAQKP